MKNKLSMLVLATVVATPFTTYAAVKNTKTTESNVYKTESNSADKGRYYIRADIGYGISSRAKVTQNTYTNDEGTIESNDKVTVNKKGKGLLGSFGVGYNIGNKVRVEGQFYFDDGLKAKGTTLTNKVGFATSVKEKTMAGFLNAYYDFNNSTKLTPYLMGGIGIARNEIKYSNADPDLSVDGISGPIKFKKKTEFAYQVGAGASYRVTPNFDVDLGYRLMKKGNGKHHSNTIQDNSLLPIVQQYSHAVKHNFNHTFLAGVRYTF